MRQLTILLDNGDPFLGAFLGYRDSEGPRRTAKSAAKLPAIAEDVHGAEEVMSDDNGEADRTFDMVSDWMEAGPLEAESDRKYQPGGEDEDEEFDIDAIEADSFDYEEEEDDRHSTRHVTKEPRATGMDRHENLPQKRKILAKEQTSEDDESDNGTFFTDLEARRKKQCVVDAAEPIKRKPGPKLKSKLPLPSRDTALDEYDPKAISTCNPLLLSRWNSLTCMPQHSRFHLM